MASPSVTQSGFFTGSGSNTLTFSSPAITSNSDCLVLGIVVEENSSTIVSVSSVSSSGVTWKKQGEFHQQMGSGAIYTVSVWTADLGSTTTYASETVTVTFSTTSDDYCATFFGVTGCAIAGKATLDNQSGNPFGGGNSSGSENLAYQTAQANDLILCLFGSDSGSSSSGPNGFTAIQSGHTWSGAYYCYMGASYESVSATQNTSLAWPGNVEQVVCVLALTSDSVTPSGTWASTEAKDSLSAACYPKLTGTFAPTEAQDIFSTPEIAIRLKIDLTSDLAITNSSPGDLLIGRNATGTWASTEAPDRADFNGHPIGQLYIDASATGGAADSGSGITVATIDLTTNNNDDVVVLCITSAGYWHRGRVTSISDTAGLIWSRRAWRQSPYGYMEMWWAHAPTPLSADVITVHTDLTGAIAINAVAIGNANYSDPWDTHILANQWTNDQPYSQPTTGRISTAAANTMLLGFYGNGQSYNAAPTSGYSPCSFLENVVYQEHQGNFAVAALETGIVTKAQDATAISFGSGGGIFTDAIVQSGLTGNSHEILWWYDGDYYDEIGTHLWPSSSNVLTAANQSVTTTITTTYTEEMLVLVALIQSASKTGTLSSVHDSIGLSPGWQRRVRYMNADGSAAIEVWWSWTNEALTSSDTVTAVTENTANNDFVQTVLFGVVGARGFYDGIFWDGDEYLPDGSYSEVGTYIDTPASPGISTINEDTLDICIMADLTSGASFTYGPNSNVDAPAALGPNANSSAPGGNIGVAFNFSVAAVTGMEFKTTLAPTGGWLAVSDAIPVGAPLPPSGIWASTESLDNMAAAGYPQLTGTFTPTEAKDKFSGAPAQAPYDSIGWLGWVPAYATWASVENKDVPDLQGWVIGVPITGKLTVTEAPDRFCFSHVTSVTGTLAATESPDRLASSGIEIPVVGPPTSKPQRIILIIN